MRGLFYFLWLERSNRMWSFLFPEFIRMLRQSSAPRGNSGRFVFYSL